MSEPLSVAVSRIAPRGFTRTLILGSLCVAAALAMQNTNVTQHDGGAIARRPILAQWIDASHFGQSAQPSAYDEESTMTRSQLLDRWDSVITEASERFHVPKAWIRAVMARESGGRTMLGEGKPIISRAGAVGLMQVLPETYDEQNRWIGALPRRD